MATTMKRKIFIIAIVVIVIISGVTIGLLLNWGDDSMAGLDEGDRISIPEGSKVIDGVVIPPEDIENFNKMGEMFLNVLPIENINSQFLDEPDYSERFAINAAVIMYNAGIRELRELTIIEIFGNNTHIKAEDDAGVIYYIDTKDGCIRYIGKESGETLFDLWHGPW